MTDHVTLAVRSISPVTIIRSLRNFKTMQGIVSSSGLESFKSKRQKMNHRQIIHLRMNVVVLHHSSSLHTISFERIA